MPDRSVDSAAATGSVTEKSSEADVKGVLVYEGGHATHAASQAFVKAISDEIHVGFGFIPFLGAGFSVSAGIPIIRHLTSYLQRCICVALGVEKPTTVEEDINEDYVRQLWNPRTDTWPPLVDRRRPESKHDWLKLMNEKYCSEKQREEKEKKGQIESEVGEIPPNPSLYLEAYGAMAEWRSALFFLSRLTLDRPRQRTDKGMEGRASQPKPVLGIPSQEVIDSCFREVMRNKLPSLNHTMLAQLSSLLRIDTILTTNFDDLTEQAFANSRNPLQIFDVHLKDTLPDSVAVSRVRSIIKLHGSQRSLRADYSLDGDPSLEDKNTFAEYLAGQKLRIGGCKEPTRNHLLVLGVGAREQRTIAFLEYSLARLKDVKIFWICYSGAEIRSIREFAKKLKLSDDNRVFVLRHTEAGLFFLHLYQAVRKTLPPSNAVYPSATRLSLPPLPNDRADLEKSKRYGQFVENLKRHIGAHALTIATAQDRVSGVTSACAEVFRSLESDYVALWIEMNDISSIDELFETLQEAAYQKLGQSDWTPLYAAKDDRPRRLEIRRIADASSKPWLICLNARELPGANRETQPSEKGNGWLDEEGARIDLRSLLDELSHARPDRIKVVLLCRDTESGLVVRPFRFADNTVILRRPPDDEHYLAVDRALEWAKDSRARRRFLHTLILMQRSRHFAVAWARCVRPRDQRYSDDPDGYCDDDDKKRLEWLNDLHRFGLIRWKDGGFVWVHSDLRQRLRTRLQDDPDTDCEEVADIHLSLSQWFLKVFDSTGVPPAIFEAVDHLCHSASNLVHGSSKRDAATPSRLLKLALDRIETSRQLLQEHEFLVQTQAYPRASMRRLDYIRDFWVPADDLSAAETSTKQETVNLRSSVLDALNSMRTNKLDRVDGTISKIKTSIAKLQCVTVSIACGIAREIGEDGEAYRRLRELGIRMSVDEPLTKVRFNATQLDSHGQRRHIHQLLHKVLKSVELRKPEERGGRRTLEEWIQWWCWCGMLGIASRSFKEADHSLAHALDAARQKIIPKTVKLAAPVLGHSVPIQPDESGSNLQPRSRWQSKLQSFPLEALDLDLKITSKSNQRRGDFYRSYLETLHAIELASYLFLCRAESETRLLALTITSLSPDQIKLQRTVSYEFMEKADKFAVKGLNLVEEIQNSGVDREGHDLELIWYKSRLLMDAGVASIRDPIRKDTGRHAMGFMGDAAACLQFAAPLRSRADLALVELRRAEVRIQEAARKEISGIGEFESWTYHCLIGDHIEGSDRADSLREKLKSEDSPAPIQAQLREINARATDALRFLNRAEPVLRERRRNVWWTTWYFERKLRAMSLILWVNIFERASPIPFLGLEAAMRLTDTEPDNLLNDAVRMIRVDGYRLAMIILAYASCARALQVRLELDTTAVLLPERLKRMRVILDHARRQLLEVVDRRNTVVDRRDTDLEQSKYAVDDTAQSVIRIVLERASNVVNSLPLPTESSNGASKADEV